MCNNDNINDHSKSKHYTDLQCCCTDLFGRNTESITDIINQCNTDHRKLVTGTEQYCYDDLYFYTDSGTMCYNDNINDNC